MTCLPADCRMDGCAGLVKARGLCNRHYIREVRHGAPDGGPPARILDDVERLWSQVDRTGDCWLWTAGTHQSGYGHVVWEGKRWRVHRLVYTLLIGAVPDDVVLDHLCRVRNCCRPEHLEPVSQRVNVQRGSRATSPTCRQGHPYDTKVTYPNGYSRRSCSTCTNRWSREWRQRQRAAS